MLTMDLTRKKVLELRGIAKQYHVKLGAGISKDGIIDKLNAQLTDAEKLQLQEADSDVVLSGKAELEPVRLDLSSIREGIEAKAATPVRPAPQTERPAPQDRYIPNPDRPAPRYSNKPAYQAPPSYQRSYTASPQRRSAAQPAPRVQKPPRPRFGPAVNDDAEEQETTEDTRLTPAGAPIRTAHTLGLESGAGFAPPREQERSTHRYQLASDAQRTVRPVPARVMNRPGYRPLEPAGGLPTAAELLTREECADGEGVLELHPDGYGFLRTPSFAPSSRDIYIAAAQIRRFGLRAGDRLTGKVRPQRDGDRYSAMLYVDTVNGAEAVENPTRKLFDELTPIYPNRKIDLDARDEVLNDMRLVDLMAPIGFGQRGLVLCPPETGKQALLQHFARVIRRNHPDAEVLALLMDVKPEDVTDFRDHATCRTIGATFDLMPEVHLRMMELTLEYAQRQVELGKDVVLLVDSLTQIAKTVSTAAAAQGRGLPGMVNPSGMSRAKRLFAAARCMREGGSLTVIAAMNMGNRVDEAAIEDFREGANMELTLDSTVAAAGVSPAFDLTRCGTRHAELLLDDAHMEGLRLTKTILGSTPSVEAIPQLLQMLDATDSNATFLQRIKDWAEMLGKSF